MRHRRANVRGVDRPQSPPGSVPRCPDVQATRRPARGCRPQAVFLECLRRPRDVAPFQFHRWGGVSRSCRLPQVVDGRDGAGCGNDGVSLLTGEGDRGRQLSDESAGLPYAGRLRGCDVLLKLNSLGHGRATLLGSGRCPNSDCAGYPRALLAIVYYARWLPSTTDRRTPVRSWFTIQSARTLLAQHSLAAAT